MICKSCGEDKNINEFTLSKNRGKDYRYPTCKACRGKRYYDKSVKPRVCKVCLKETSDFKDNFVKTCNTCREEGLRRCSSCGRTSLETRFTGRYAWGKVCAECRRKRQKELYYKKKNGNTPVLRYNTMAARHPTRPSPEFLAIQYSQIEKLLPKGLDTPCAIADEMGVGFKDNILFTKLMEKAYEMA